MLTLYMQRAAVESALITQASSQSILHFHRIRQKTRAGNQPALQKRLPFVKKSQCNRLRQMVVKVLGASPFPWRTLA
jgi:hypothetical protein